MKLSIRLWVSQTGLKNRNVAIANVLLQKIRSTAMSLDHPSLDATNKVIRVIAIRYEMRSRLETFVSVGVRNTKLDAYLLLLLLTNLKNGLVSL